MENYSWRLVSDLVAYFPSGTKTVYLAATEKKNYQAAVIKQISGCYDEVPITLNEFEVKLGYSTDELYVDPLKLYVRNEEFPSSEVWYKVCNFDFRTLGKLLTQLVCNKGNFTDTFEAAFCEEAPSLTFVRNDMAEYKSYFNEMKRRLNCELFKKTKKWIPGHRYDTLKTSYYYLCSVVSRKKDIANSEFISDITLMPEGILYVENIKPEDKSVSDIFKNRSFGDGPYDIKVMPSSKLMVDCGEALVDDFSGDIRDYWAEMIQNSVKDAQEKEESSDYTWCKDIKRVLDIFAYQTSGKADIIVNEDSKKILTKAIRSSVFDVILRNWNIEKFRATSNIGTKVEDKENKAAILKMFISSIRDANFLKNVYYPELLKAIGIDLESIVNDVYSGWDENQIYSSFDNYRRYLFYVIARSDASRVISTQRVKSTNYKLDVVTLEDLYGNGELRKLLLEIINDARDSFGLGVSDYVTINMGTKKEPKEYTNCKITLEDVLSFKTKKGVVEMSETLKNEIMRFRFCCVSVSFDKEGEVK